MPNISGTYTGEHQTPPLQATTDVDYPGNDVAWGVKSSSRNGNGGYLVIIYHKDWTKSPTISPATLNPTTNSPTTYAPTRSPSTTSPATGHPTLTPTTPSPATCTPTHSPTTSQPTMSGPTPIVARYGDAVSTIALHFNIPTDTPAASSPKELCFMLLDASTVGILGDEGHNPECFWATDTHLSIKLGRGFRASPMDRIVTKPGYIRRKGAGNEEATTGRAEVSIQPPMNPQPVAVSIVGMDLIGPCNQSVELAALESGGAGRAFTYSWKYLGSNVAHNQSLIIQMDNVTSSAKRILKVPTEAFKVGSRHTFNLTVQNWLGSSTSAVHSIYKGSTMAPVLRFSSPNRISVKRSSPLEIPVQVRKAECGLSSTTSLRTFGSWSQVAGPTQISIPDPFSLYLRLSAFTLEMLEDYAFQFLAVTKDANDQTVGAANVTFFVSVIDEPVSAVIVGGTSRLISLSNLSSSSSLITFLATASIDPAYPSHRLQYNWSVVDSMSSQQIAIPTSSRNRSLPELTIGKEALTVNKTYLVYLNVTSFAAGQPRYARSRQMVQTTDLGVLEAAIVTTAENYLNVKDKLMLSVVAKDGDTVLNETSVVRRWECTSGNLNLSDPSILRSSTTASNLILQPHALSGGSEFVFVVHVKSSTPGPSRSLSGWASIRILTNSPPSLGFCSSTPNTGTALVTSFRLACDQWTDQDLPLRYKFQMVTSSHSLSEAEAAEGMNTTLSVGSSQQNQGPPIYLSLCNYRGIGIYETVLSENPNSRLVVIRALVADNFGASSSFLFTVSVLPMSPSMLSEVTATMESRMQEGDMQNYVVYAGGIAAHMNSPVVETSISNAAALRISMLESVNLATGNSTSARVLPPQTSAALIASVTAANRSGEIQVDSYGFALEVVDKVLQTAGGDNGESGNLDVAIPLSKGVANLLFTTNGSAIAPETLAATESTFANLSSYLLGGTFIGEDPTTLTSTNAQDGSTTIHLTGRLINGLDLENASLVHPSTGCSAIFQPPPPSSGNVRSSAQSATALELSVTSIEGHTIYPSSLDSSLSIVAGTSYIDVRDASTGGDIRIQNASRPIRFTVPGRMSGVNYTSDSMDYRCAYWNGNEWSTEGVQMAGVSEETGIPMCQSDHLTPFSVFAKEKVEVEVNTIRTEDVQDFRALDPTKNPIMALVLIVFAVALCLYPCMRYYDLHPFHSETSPGKTTAMDEYERDRLLEMHEIEFWRELNTAQYLHTEARTSCKGWRDSSWIAMRRRHTWLSVWFRHPGDFLNSQKRLIVLILLIMNSAAVCALLEGTTNNLPFLSGSASKAVVACLISFPIPFTIMALLARQPPKRFRVKFRASSVASSLPWIFFILSVCVGDTVDSVQMKFEDEEDGEVGGNDQQADDEDNMQERHNEGAEEDENDKDKKEDAQDEGKHGSSFVHPTQIGATTGAIAAWSAASATKAARPSNNLSASTTEQNSSDIDGKDDRKNFARSQSMVMHSSHIIAPNKPVMERERTFLGPAFGEDVRNHEWTRDDTLAMISAIVLILGCAYILVVLSWSLRERSSMAVETMVYCLGQDAAFRTLTILAVETMLLLFLIRNQNTEAMNHKETDTQIRESRVVTVTLSSDVPSCVVNKHGRVESTTEEGAALGIQVGWKVILINGVVVDTEKMRRKATQRAHAMGSSFNVTFDSDLKAQNSGTSDESSVSQFHSGIDPDPDYCGGHRSLHFGSQPNEERRRKIRLITKTVLFRDMSHCSLSDSIREHEEEGSSSDEEPGWGSIPTLQTFNLGSLHNKGSAVHAVTTSVDANESKI